MPKHPHLFCEGEGVEMGPDDTKSENKKKKG